MTTPPPIPARGGPSTEYEQRPASVGATDFDEEYIAKPHAYPSDTSRVFVQELCHACCTLHTIQSSKVIHKLTMRIEMVTMETMTVATESLYDCGHSVIRGGQMSVYPENRPFVLRKVSPSVIRMWGLTLPDNAMLCMKAFAFGTVVVTCVDKKSYIKMSRNTLEATSGNLKVHCYTDF